jgi:hypothetical protein
MKITIIKKATKGPKLGSCDVYVDDYPLSKR